MNYQLKKQQLIADNPFFGKSALKTLLQEGKSITTKQSMFTLLNNAWNEAKDKKETREGFFIICFNICEIENRQHNIFGKNKVDNGGNSKRPQGHWIMSWMRQNTSIQYYRFMFNTIINQFISWFILLSCQIRTVKGKKSINTIDTETFNSLKEHDLDKLSEYVATTLKKGSVIDKIMLAKWLVLPRLSKRQKINKQSKEKDGYRELQQVTKDNMIVRQNFLLKLSELMNWEVIKYPKNYKFVGLIKFKQEYNQSLESVLFSTGKIKEMDKEQFFNLLNNCPSGARYRIRRRLLDKDDKSKGKWNSNYGFDFAEQFLAWEKFKENKQQEVRIVEEKIKQGIATEKEVNNLAKLKNEAKVNTGAKGVMDTLLDSLIAQTLDTNIEIHSIIEKTSEMPNIGIIKDVSSSTESNYITYKGTKIASAIVANILLTYILYKTNYDKTKNLVFSFGNTCKVVDVEARTDIKTNNNRYFTDNNTIKAKVFNPEDNFTTNYNRIVGATSRQVLNISDGTNLNCFVQYLVDWSKDDVQKKELVASIPIWLVLSDADLNSHYNATASMNAVKNMFKHHFGVEPIIVVLSLVDETDSFEGKRTDYFKDIEGVIHKFGSNIGEISSIFKNMSDIDIPDGYIELKTLWLSNRYQIIKENVI